MATTVLRTGRKQAPAYAFAPQGARRRIGARFDQFGRVINYSPDGTVAPAGTPGVGAVRPAQAGDNIGATSTSAEDWRKRFPNRPDGSARDMVPQVGPAAFQPVTPVPAPGDAGFIGPVQPQPVRPASSPVAFQPGANTDTRASNNQGETYRVGGNEGLTMEYDPRKDATRNLQTKTDAFDPSRVTRTLSNEYGSGSATVNGGARITAEALPDTMNAVRHATAISEEAQRKVAKFQAQQPVTAQAAPPVPAGFAPSPQPANIDTQIATAKQTVANLPAQMAAEQAAGQQRARDIAAHEAKKTELAMQVFKAAAAKHNGMIPRSAWTNPVAQPAPIAQSVQPAAPVVPKAFEPAPVAQPAPAPGMDETEEQKRRRMAGIR